MRQSPRPPAAVTLRTSVASTPDVSFVIIPVVQAAALISYPSIPLVAVGLWWTANTVSHNFIHRPFFTSAVLNVLFSLLLTGVMGLPQTLWRQRHLAHHGGRAWRLRWNVQLGAELALLTALWSVLALLAPSFLLSIYLPGWLCGLGMCAVQGHYEHAGGTTSHYGRLYNLLCFNDGYHAEHHARPGVHWTQLPGRTVADARTSRWPPLLRWLELANLNQLERLVLRSALLQRIVLRAHRRAFIRLRPHIPAVDRIAIVGGGLFPRSALILRDLFPAARIVIIEREGNHLETARHHLGPDVEFEWRQYPSLDELAGRVTYDLLVIPLAFDGDRDAIYRRPPAHVLVHDWIWRPRGLSCVVSAGLLKRLNLVTRRT